METNRPRRSFVPTLSTAVALALAAFPAVASAQSAPAASRPAAESRPAGSDLRAPGESRRFASLRQLTFGGENAEAYFSTDDKSLIFQSTRPPYGCDQIFTMAADGSNVRLVSTGKGKCTCAYFFPGGERILFASTHAASPECPPKPDYSKGYVWRVEPTFELYVAKADGSDARPLAASPGYDAEATISRDGSRIVFTSDRDGDLEIYSMRSDGSDVKRLTRSPGYDGGAFFSADGTKIVYRSRRIEDPKELADYQSLLASHLVRPTKLEIHVMDADGSNARAVTSLGAASFAPFLHPDGKRILFSSNCGDPRGREFDLYLIGIDGEGLERVTFSMDFDGFPMWSSDGRQVVFASNRNGTQPRETNLFMASWIDAEEPKR